MNHFFDRIYGDGVDEHRAELITEPDVVFNGGDSFICQGFQELDWFEPHVLFAVGSSTGNQGSIFSTSQIGSNQQATIRMAHFVLGGDAYALYRMTPDGVPIVSYSQRSLNRITPGRFIYLMYNDAGGGQPGLLHTYSDGVYGNDRLSNNNTTGYFNHSLINGFNVAHIGFDQGSGGSQFVGTLEGLQLVRGRFTEMQFREAVNMGTMEAVAANNAFEVRLRGSQFNAGTGVWQDESPNAYQFIR